MWGVLLCPEELGTGSSPQRQWDVSRSVLSGGLFRLLRWENKTSGSPVAASISAFATHLTCESPQRANSQKSQKSAEL